VNKTYSETDNFLKFGFLLIILAVFLIGYFPVLQKMLIRWNGGDNSYCYLIVPLFAYLLWDKRKEQKEGRWTMDDGRKKAMRSIVPQPSEAVLPPPSVQSTEDFRFGEFSWSVWGLVLVILSILLIIVGELGSVETLLYTGIWGCAVGVTVILYGWRTRYLIFPLVILLFIVPLPAFINRILTFKLKLAATTLSVTMLRASGVSVLQEGNIIDLGISQLQVVDACSGLRYLMPLLLTALLVGYFFNKRWWQRAILILVVVPLSIFVNSVRIWITGLLTVKGHEELAQSFFHDFSGWLVYMFAAGLLVVAALILKRIGERYADRGKRLEVGGQEGEKVRRWEGQKGRNEWNTKNAPKTQGMLRPVVLTIILCFLFAGSGWALKRIPSARNLPQRTAFDSFPMQIGQWQGKRHYISKEIMKSLWADDYISVTYTRPGSPNHISLLIPFYEYQGTRHTAHAPQACMLGSGWALFNSSERLININPGDEIKIMTMTWEKGNYKLLGSYFFLQRGRVITSPWMNKFYLMWDAFTKRRTDGALVRVEMTVAPGQPIEKEYGVLEGFIAKLWPILPDYIPG